MRLRPPEAMYRDADKWAADTFQHIRDDTQPQRLEARCRQIAAYGQHFDLRSKAGEDMSQQRFPGNGYECLIDTTESGRPAASRMSPIVTDGMQVI
ncbi:MAG: hypothetical protein WD823_00530 [Sulfuricaulis sp.]